MEQDIYRAPREQGPRIAAIGGGHGLSTMLRGLKQYTENLTAIVTVADDGGGSGMLRQDLGMPPPGDIRSCMEALANTEPVMRAAAALPLHRGDAWRDRASAICSWRPSTAFPSPLTQAVSRMSQVLAITGRVLPVTNGGRAAGGGTLKTAPRVVGESKIFYCKKQEDCRIRQVRLIPEHPKALPEAVAAIARGGYDRAGAREPVHQHHPQPAGGRHRGGDLRAPTR